MHIHVFVYSSKEADVFILGKGLSLTARCHLLIRLHIKLNGDICTSVDSTGEASAQNICSSACMHVAVYQKCYAEE